MKIRDVLVFLDQTDASDRRLKLAKGIAHSHNASLDAAFFPVRRAGSQSKRQVAAPWLGLASGAPVGAGITVLETGDATVVAEELLTQFSGHHRDEEWSPFEAVDIEALIRLARSADLIVAGQVNPYRAVSKWRPEELVVKCGRPVLMVPYIGDYEQIGRRVMVAWDASREATRALHDAFPLMVNADVVTLVTIHSDERERDQMRITTERMVRHLDQHGIAVTVDEVSRLGGSVGDIILSRTVDLGADLMVAGASRHSQWHDAVFGGVSREFFRQMTLPVLVSC
jgi:nucleotide-binding universal stress UspA family protein